MHFPFAIEMNNSMKNDLPIIKGKNDDHDCDGYDDDD